MVREARQRSADWGEQGAPLPLWLRDQQARQRRPSLPGEGRVGPNAFERRHVIEHGQGAVFEGFCQRLAPCSSTAQVARQEARQEAFVRRHTAGSTRRHDSAGEMHAPLRLQACSRAYQVMHAGPLRAGLQAIREALTGVELHIGCVVQVCRQAYGKERLAGWGATERRLLAAGTSMHAPRRPQRWPATPCCCHAAPVIRPSPPPKSLTLKLVAPHRCRAVDLEVEPCRRRWCAIATCCLVLRALLLALLALLLLLLLLLVRGWLILLPGLPLGLLQVRLCWLLFAACPRRRRRAGGGSDLRSPGIVHLGTLV